MVEVIMRILHVNKFFDFHGGAEIYLHRLMDAQQRAGHDVHVFSTHSDKNIPSPDASHFVTRYHLDRRNGWKTDAQIARNYLWNVEAKKAIAEQIAGLKPDVIHVHNIYNHLSTSVLAPIRASGIPCVQTLHDYKVAGCPAYSMFTEGAPCERCKGGNYLNAIKHRCTSASFLPNMLAALEMGIVKTRRPYERTVRLFICPSRFMQEKMEDWGEPASKLRYVPNPADFGDEPVVGGGGYLLFAGRLSAEKGLASLIEAVAQIPELPLKIAGRGSGRQSVEAMVRSLVQAKAATNVEFLGFVPPNDLARIRHRAEAIVLPSIWYENSSLALLDAMADGIPCLTTRIGGSPELVEDGVNGFLARPNDVADWVRVLRRFQATSPEARREMGRRGREIIKANHLWSTHLDRLMQVYEEAGMKR